MVPMFRTPRSDRRLRLIKSALWYFGVARLGMWADDGISLSFLLVSCRPDHRPSVSDAMGCGRVRGQNWLLVFSDLDVTVSLVSSIWMHPLEWLISMCCVLLFCSKKHGRDCRVDPPGVPYSYFILRPTLPPCCYDAPSEKPKQRTEIDDDVDVQSGAAWKTTSETLKL